MNAEIEIDGADVGYILNEIPISEIIEHYEYEKLLDEMDREDAIEYLNL